ncbi:MAG TPA: MFS transporter, partial [Pyrinomonadaceae bacterium]|nr:MFS transporter [Pyrinomonadaceae bacterium]
VAVSIGAGFLAGVAMFGAITFVPFFAQGALGATATEAGSLLTPLMLSWVGMAVIGGRLLLRVGYKPTSVVGFILLTAGLALLANFNRDTRRIWLYLDLIMIGAGLGLTMLTLLIAVQQAVPRAQLGIATSLNQFFRSIGGAVGVAVMGTVLSAGLTSYLSDFASRNPQALAPQRAAELAANPNALIEPAARATLTPTALDALQSAFASAIHNVFWVATVVSALALLASFALPREGDAGASPPPPEEACSTEQGERLVATELTTFDPEHEPVEQV